MDWHQAMPGDFIMNNGESHLFRIHIGSNLQRLQAFAATLTPSETERCNKYHQLKDRQRFIISRGAQRSILSRYLNQTAEELQFVLGDNKKPYLPDTRYGTGLQYNITHAGEWILLAVADRPVGADVEFIDSAFPFADILPEHFSQEEMGFVNAANQHDRFFTLWTRKEALLKATGQGLGEYLKSTPSLDGKHALPGNLLGSEKDWQISSFNLTDSYKASIAAGNEIRVLRFFDVSF
ncbi:4'-phosphopantetheinyl transferase family protein [Mucilaginibacter psychrotolerans]|uniref:4'-phosphopantetheinyl transferase superfamily protein n=1 Tax=Mucilaginibacter psychrotolerans TaxID=1524096 RepID=A0A4Y8SBQ5_9SPHI|nr:4'-phosphopantetheinyl transferase superfamily protein [Mucilaginibacter psychrotolerans]TFF36332.1 4'-phosphopantetheinyl transferase superfamily protein [Mucilaginibacter psychrotolerans]